jgi:hypothetical protein
MIAICRHFAPTLALKVHCGVTHGGNKRLRRGASIAGISLRFVIAYRMARARRLERRLASQRRRA